MLNEIYVVNVKCNGCANTIKRELENLGIKNVEVHFTKEDSPKKRRITFEWDYNVVKEALAKLWYPEYWTKEAKSLLKKTISFFSCSMGKLK